MSLNIVGVFCFCCQNLLSSRVNYNTIIILLYYILFFYKKFAGDPKLAAAPVRQFSFQYLFFKMVFLKQPDALHCTAFFEEKKCLGCLTNHQAVRAVNKNTIRSPNTGHRLYFIYFRENAEHSVSNIFFNSEETVLYSLWVWRRDARPKKHAAISWAANQG